METVVTGLLWAQTSINVRAQEADLAACNITARAQFCPYKRRGAADSNNLSLGAAPRGCAVLKKAFMKQIAYQK